MENTRTIRPYDPGDEAAVVSVWHRAGKAAYTFLPTWQSFSWELAGEVFREGILARCQLWVGAEAGRVLAFMAMQGSMMDRLYVDPDEWRRGWGSQFVDLAKSLFPQGLELYTHVENRMARVFYEKRGFKAVKFGVSPPPESAPDVEYHWRP